MPLKNGKFIDTKGLLEDKKQKYKSLKKSNKKYHDYLIYEYYHHYRMIDECLKANYFIKDSKLNTFLEDIVNNIQINNNQNVNESIKYSVLIVQTDDINAYSFGDGILAVTMGLILSLDNQSELASVLCHELAHDILHHNEKTMALHANLHTSNEIKDSISFVLEDENYSVTRIEEYLAKVYSENIKKNRHNELVADSLGLILFWNSGFPAKTAATALSKIDKPYLGKKDNSIIDYLSAHQVAINKKWYYAEEVSRLDDIVNNGKDVYFMDTIKTHPEISERIKKLNEMARVENKVVESADYEDIISYKELQINCMVQTILNNYRNDNPAKAIHYALIFKSEFPEQTFSDNIILISLCKGAFLKQYLRLTLNIGSTDSSNGPGQNEIIYLMQKIKQNEFKDLICKLRETVNGQTIADIYSNTANLFSGYFCYNDNKYNYVMRNYLKIYKKDFFKYDLIYLPKKKKTQKK